MNTATTFKTLRHRAFIIDIKITEDKEYYFYECKRLDGSLIHDDTQHYDFEDLNECIEEAKECIDQFLDN